MSKSIELSETELEKLKQLALTNYKQKSVRGMSPDAFWSKCILEATRSLLNNKGVEFEIIYPDHYKEIDK